MSSIISMRFRLIILVIIVSSLGFCQDVNEIKLNQIGQLLEIARNLEAKIEGLDDRMTSMDESISAMDGKMNELKQQVSSNQENVLQKIEEQNCGSDQRGSSSLDQLYQTFADIFEEEFDFKRDIMKTTCSKSQVESLQTLLATNECLEGSHNCSSEASCSDLIIGFRCTCNEGYEGDGVTCQETVECLRGRGNCSIHSFCSNVEGRYKCICLPGFTGEGSTCIDVDECSNGVSQCHKDADCINNDGSFTCSCKHGYSGDGFSCVAKQCVSPFINLQGLGCVTLVEDSKTWEDSQKHCRTLGGRLLEGIESQQQLDLLEQQFQGKYPWIGLRDLQWVSGGEPIDPESPLWEDAEPDQGNDQCVDACLGCSRPSLWDVPCNEVRKFLCQSN